MAINQNKLFAGYIPVLHQGYIEAFDRNPDLAIGIFDKSVTEFLPYLKKDIRALEPAIMEKCIRGLGREAFVLTRSDFEDSLDTSFVMPSDDLTDAIEQHYPTANITREPVFLRWDRNATTTNIDVAPDREITMDSHHPIIDMVEQQKLRSTNWWRHIGAVLTNNDNDIIAIANNTPLPTAHSSWIDGDPRITAKRGEDIDRSIDIHAEAALIAEAARTGQSLDGTDLYVSTFPCPNCAKMIARSGIKACYYVEGYAMIDGLSVMKSADIEIVKINVSGQTPEDHRGLKSYS